MQFRNTVYSCLPHADIVADKYHVIRQANWMIRDVRIRLFNSDAKYREYKKYWKLIAKNPNSTFSPSQKKRLKKLKNLSEIFSRAYDLRTKFFSIFEIKEVTIFSWCFCSSCIKYKICVHFIIHIFLFHIHML